MLQVYDYECAAECPVFYGYHAFLELPGDILEAHVEIILEAFMEIGPPQTDNPLLTPDCRL